jgi:prepilin-type N-terminal cleavage/methylation domain-containing protein
MTTRDARTRRAGFTLVELLLVMVIISILAGLAIPNYRIMVTKARAADLLGRVDVVEHAAQGYLGDNSTWPADAGPGSIPSGVTTYLPENFAFTGEDYQLDWENGGGLVGVGIVTDNTALGDALVDLAGPGRWFVSGNRYVFIIDQS